MYLLGFNPRSILHLQFDNRGAVFRGRYVPVGDNAAVPHPIHHSLALDRYRAYMASARYTGELRSSTRRVVGFDVSGVLSVLTRSAEVSFGRSGNFGDSSQVLQMRPSQQSSCCRKCDEWLYCIDANADEIASSSIDEEPLVEYAYFDDYLADRLNDAIENLQKRQPSTPDTR